MVYANKPATIDELRSNIEREIAAVSTDLCLKIVKSWVQRLDFCKRISQLAMQMKSSLIHNGIKCTFAEI